MEPAHQSPHDPYVTLVIALATQIPWLFESLPVVIKIVSGLAGLYALYLNIKAKNLEIKERKQKLDKND